MEKGQVLDFTGSVLSGISLDRVDLADASILGMVSGNLQGQVLGTIDGYTAEKTFAREAYLWTGGAGYRLGMITNTGSPVPVKLSAGLSVDAAGTIYVSADEPGTEDTVGIARQMILRLKPRIVSA
jgi:hypothetical protein